MKHFPAVFAAMMMASPAFAGVTYNVQSTTSGMRHVNIAGKVTVDGPHVRFDVSSGDKMLFADNAVVLSNDGGKTMTVLDPANKTYFELHLDDVLNSTTAALKNLGGGMFKLSFDNPSVTVHDAGNGETLEGFPTHKSVLDAAYDINIDAAGQKLTTKIKMTTESWMTDQLSSEFASFLQTRGLHTGVEPIDKLIEAQRSAISGFPLKQVSTTHVNQGGSDVTMTTTATVSNVEKKTVDAALFAMPSGYTKVDDPISKMLKALK